MNRPFQPAGERARWRILYELLASVPTDGVLTYETMGRALDLDPVDQRHTIQLAMRRAAKQHEKFDKRAVEAEPNVGYRVVHAAEHMRLAQSQQKRARGALVRGHSKVENVDFNELDAASRKAFEFVGYALAMQLEYTRRLDVRQSRMQKALETVAERTDRTEAEIAELTARLARLEDDPPLQDTDDAS